MEKFQHSKVANNQVIGQKQSAMATFLACLEDREDFDQEQADYIKTFLSTMSARRGGRGRGGKRGGTRGGHAGNNNTKANRIWKCDYCLCNCFPKWEPCGCAYSSHKKEECPHPNPIKVKAYRKRKAEQDQERSAKRQQEGSEKDKEGPSFITFTQDFADQVAQEESEHETLSLIVNNVKEVEAEPQPLQELFKVLQREEEPKDQEHRGMTCQQIHTNGKRETIYLENTTTKHWHRKDKKGEHELSMLLDCGSPSTIIGVEDFKQVIRQYTPMIQSEFKYRQSNKHYEFGGGRKTYSLGKVRLPVYVVDNEGNPHLLYVWIEILNQSRLPLLLGSKSLHKVNGTLSFGEQTLTIDWKGKRLCLPINQANSGHFHLQFFPMSQAEENFFTREMVSKADWSQEETENVIAYIARERRPQIEKMKRPGILKKHKEKKPLSKQQVIHLHQSLGHIHPDKVKGLVKRTKMWNNNTINAIDDLNQCITCAVECSETSNSKEAEPKTIGHNHILAIDLKQNHKYRDAPPFILYLCDTFSKLKTACFLNDKESATIAHHLVTEWIKYHGPPKYIMGNKDAGIFKGEVKELCLLHGINYTNTT